MAGCNVLNTCFHNDGHVEIIILNCETQERSQKMSCSLIDLSVMWASFFNGLFLNPFQSISIINSHLIHYSVAAVCNTFKVSWDTLYLCAASSF